MAASSKDVGTRAFNPEAAPAPLEATDFSAWKGWPGFVAKEDVLRRIGSYLAKHADGMEVDKLNQKKAKLTQEIKEAGALCVVDEVKATIIIKYNQIKDIDKEILEHSITNEICTTLQSQLSSLEGSVYPSSFYLQMIFRKAAVDFRFFSVDNKYPTKKQIMDSLCLIDDNPLNIKQIEHVLCLFPRHWWRDHQDDSGEMERSAVEGNLRLYHQVFNDMVYAVKKEELIPPFPFKIFSWPD